MKVKLFTCYNTEDTENEINIFMKDIYVKYVTQSSCGRGYIIISIFYEEK